MEHRIVAVTPAGRRRYLELLKHYILSDTSIQEWILWDNCRDPQDRIYINRLEAEHSKIKIIRLDNVDGTNKSVNRFYRFCDDERAFYIKMDDDLVYLPKQFGSSLYACAIKERGQFLWWSPMVINNAICSWLLKYHSPVKIERYLSCQASDFVGWREPSFAKDLHSKFLAALAAKDLQAFIIPDFIVSLSRFSINCLGFFGEDVKKCGEKFCPPDVDDEEWLSACLPSIVGRPGRVSGSLVVSHFAFFTQEMELLRSGVLENYYRVADVVPTRYPVRKPSLKSQVRLLLLRKLH